MLLVVEAASLPFHGQLVDQLELGAGAVGELHLAFVIEDDGTVVRLVKEGVQELVLDEDCDFVDNHGVFIPLL